MEKDNMKKVTIYTTPTCKFCHMAKEFFKEHNVAYEEKDVMTDAQARQAAVEKSGQMGVPVIDVDGEIVVGFDQEKLTQLLGIAS
jgi:glutaredoxin 3